MNRTVRTLLVLTIAVAAAAAASFGVYRAVMNRPTREVEAPHLDVVVAARPLSTGAQVKRDDVKIVQWPAQTLIAGGFSQIDAVIDRGVIATVLENEPLTESKIAPLSAGAGLPPTIPPGMRAISIKVNEVIGVAGFVVPGTRVDLFVTLKEQTESMTRVVVSNVQVLTAGTRYDQEKAKTGEPIPSTVVTLLLSPPEAERVVLASTEGQIMLALRNPLDSTTTTTDGTRMASLTGHHEVAAKPMARARVTAVAVAAPPVPLTPPAPRPYVVEAIRAAKRSEESIR